MDAFFQEQHQSLNEVLYAPQIDNDDEDTDDDDDNDIN